MILRDAESVRTALELAAGVDAFSHALADLEADLLRLAVEIVRAVIPWMTSLREVVRVSLVAWRTEANAVLADGSRTAGDAAALVETLAVHAAVVRRAGGVLTALATVRIRAYSSLENLTADERIAEQAVLAATIVAADRVYANGIYATGVAVALVYVVTFYERIASVTRRTDALNCVRAGVTVSVLAAYRARTFGLLLRAAAVVGISARARIAYALEVLGVVFAVSVLTAAGLAARRLDRRHAEKIWIAHEIWIADALVGIGIAARAYTADYALAATLAATAYADARLCAGHVRRAHVRHALTTGEWISHEALDALAGWTIVADDALGSGAADETIAF